jgi:endoglucanase
MLGFVAAIAACALVAPPAFAGAANGGLAHAPRGNPLAGLPWGTYTGTGDGLYPAYQSARGRDRQLLARIALRPLAFWFGAWDRDSDAGNVARQYIANVTAGDPNKLAQLTVFRLDPWEQDACSHVPGPAAQASYRNWTDNFAAGIGRSRVAMILQPDLPFATCSPNQGVVLGLVAYAAKRFSALPHTTVYIDAGAWQWTSPDMAASLLVRAGVRHVRGFVLNATQYGSTQDELGFGANIISALGARGVHGTHFVVNTSQNGAPFLAGQYHGNVVNPRVCANASDHICATLGIPPTWHVTDSRWHLSGHARSIAGRYADAYLWVGRPWLDNGAYPFDLGRALGLAASSPF